MNLSTIMAAICAPILFAAFALSLPSCTTAEQTATLAALSAACATEATAAQLAETTLHGGALGTAEQVIAPAAAFCAIVKAGTVPSNADGNSVNWLAVITQTIQTVQALTEGTVASAAP